MTAGALTPTPRATAPAPADEEARFALLPTTRFVLPVAVALGALLAVQGATMWMRVSSAVAAGLLVLLNLWAARGRPVLVLGPDGYRVEVRGRVRFAVPWSSVRRVLCDETEQALYVDCGDRARNLLLPPSGGFAFTFARRAELYAAVRGAVPDKIEVVARIDTVLPPPALPAEPRPEEAGPPKE